MIKLDRHDKMIRKNSPFFSYFNQMYKDILLKAKASELKEKENNNELVENRFYHPGFFKYLLGFHMPYFPLWSGCMLKDVQLLRNSNATVENFFNFVKNKCLNGKLRIELARFINIMAQYVLDTINRQQYSNQTTRQLMNKVKKVLLENWGGENSGRKKFVNKYFNDEKYLMPMIRPAITKENCDTEYFSQFVSRIFLDDNYKEFIRNKIDEVESMCKEKKSDQEDKEEEQNIKEEQNVREKLTPTFYFSSDEEEEASDDGSTDSVLDYGIDMNEFLHVKIDETDKSVVAENLKQFLTECRVDEARALLFPVDKDLPDYTNFICKIKRYSTDKDDMATLKPDVFVNDNILNAFIALQVDHAQKQGFSVVSLDTVLTKQMMAGKFSPGFEKFLSKQFLSSHSCWLLPLNVNRNHWTLLVVDVKQAKLTYLNSNHRDPPTNAIKRVMSLIEIYTEGPAKKWQLYVPDDTPEQIEDVNCGLHVCLWAYIICNRLELDFVSFHPSKNLSKRALNDTDYARVGVAHILMNADPEEYPETDLENEICQKYFDTFEKDFTPKERQSEIIILPNDFVKKVTHVKETGPKKEEKHLNIALIYQKIIVIKYI